jgi:uncharacterized protein (DUF983 family)
MKGTPFPAASLLIGVVKFILVLFAPSLWAHVIVAVIYYIIEQTSFWALYLRDRRSILRGLVAVGDPASIGLC